MIRVLFFASLRERLGCSELQVEASACKTLEALRQHLSERGDNWRGALADPSLQMALNREVVAPESARKDTVASGDEVAFFPPVTGG